MPNTIGTNGSDEIIVVAPGGIISDDSVTNLYDAAAVWSSGDALPADLGDMLGGTFTSSGAYTAPPPGPDWVDRFRAWDEAVADWLDNGTMNDDIKWKRCVKTGNKDGMDDTCWTNIIAAYPAS